MSSQLANRVFRPTAVTAVIVAVLFLVCFPSATLSPVAEADVSIAETYDDTATGAARGVTGGKGGEVVTVTSLADEGPGSLREAAAGSGPKIVTFGVSGTIVLGDVIQVPSNFTIDGRGARVTIANKGLVIAGVNNVIVRNLKFRGGVDSDSNDDAIALLDGARRVWIDHNDFTGFKDGLVDVTRSSTDVTISWNYFHDHDKTMLLGAASPEGTPPMVDMTIHHNLIIRARERNPLMRHGRYFVFSNVIRDWGYDVDSGYGLRADCGAQAVVVENVLVPGENKRAMTIVPPRRCDRSRPSILRAAANQLNGAVGQDAKPEQAFTPDDATLANVEEAGSDLIKRIEAAAGVHDLESPYAGAAGRPSDGGPRRPSSNVAPTMAIVGIGAAGLIAGATIAFLAMRMSRRRTGVRKP